MAYTFTARTVHGFEDVNLNFEQLEQLLSGGSGQKAAVLQLESVQQLVGAAGVVAVAFSGASQTSSTVTVTHNIGRVPTVTLSAVQTNDPFFVIPNLVLGSATTTQFQLRAFAPQGNPAAQNVVLGWHAIG